MCQARLTLAYPGGCAPLQPTTDDAVAHLLSAVPEEQLYPLLYQTAREW